MGKQPSACLRVFEGRRLSLATCVRWGYGLMLGEATLISLVVGAPSTVLLRCWVGELWPKLQEQ